VGAAVSLLLDSGWGVGVAGSGNSYATGDSSASDRIELIRRLAREQRPFKSKQFCGLGNGPHFRNYLARPSREDAYPDDMVLRSRKSERTGVLTFHATLADFCAVHKHQRDVTMIIARKIGDQR